MEIFVDWGGGGNQYFEQFLPYPKIDAKITHAYFLGPSYIGLTK